MAQPVQWHRQNDPHNDDTCAPHNDDTCARQGLRNDELLKNIRGLRARLTRVTRNPDLAADLLQDAVVTALEKLHCGELAAGSPIEGYLYRVALNHFRNHRRKDRVRTSKVTVLALQTEHDPANRTVDCLEQIESAHFAKQVLKEITPRRDREILARFYLEGESKEQLCRFFGLSALHFNRVIHRARDRFKALLTRRGLVKSDLLADDRTSVANRSIRCMEPRLVLNHRDL